MYVFGNCFAAVIGKMFEKEINGRDKTEDWLPFEHLSLHEYN